MQSSFAGFIIFTPRYIRVNKFVILSWIRLLLLFNTIYLLHVTKNTRTQCVSLLKCLLTRFSCPLLS